MPPAPWDPRDPRDTLVPPVSVWQASQVRMVPQACLDPSVLKATPDPPEPLVLLVSPATESQVLTERREQLEPQVAQVALVRRESREPADTPALLVPLDQLARPAHRAPEVSQGRAAPSALRVTQVPAELRDLRDTREIRVCRDSRESRVIQVPPAPPAPEEPPVLRETKVTSAPLAHLAATVSPAPLDLKVTPAAQARTVPPALMVPPAPEDPLGLLVQSALPA